MEINQFHIFSSKFVTIRNIVELHQKIESAYETLTNKHEGLLDRLARLEAIETRLTRIEALIDRLAKIAD